MADLETLLADFRAAYEAGERPDLSETLARASPEQRQALREKLDSYLMNAPRRAWDPVAYETSPARESVERVWESLEGVSGSWPELLPHLRHRARLKRAELVSRLAAALGVADRTEKVARYYNEMEHGQLPAGGVSGRVFEALAEILGESVERIRDAGLAASPPAPGTAAPAFTRIGTLDEDLAAPPAGTTPVGEGPEAERAAERDEVDELFTGA